MSQKQNTTKENCLSTKVLMFIAATVSTALDISLAVKKLHSHQIHGL
jgi:hypothetical protein